MVVFGLLSSITAMVDKDLAVLDSKGKLSRVQSPKEQDEG
jgi:hypothetical protein